MESRTSVLGVGAHPDDLEMMAAGTLAKYALSAHGVTMAYLTNGDMGHAVIPPEELAAIRREEALEATRVLGAGFEWLALRDEWLMRDRQTRTAVVELIRKIQPEIIITHSPLDYHPDHRAAHHLVFDASFLATIPHIESAYPAVQHVPRVYCMDSLGGIEFRPDRYVDITDVFEKKIEALLRHKSQVQWLRDHDNVDLVDYMTTMARFRGLQCGVRFAECFELVRRWPAVPVADILA